MQRCWSLADRKERTVLRYFPATSSEWAMKILYIASERSRAQVATRALRAIAPNVTVLWGSNFERAAFSILENPDLAALIVEVQSDTHGCSYLKQMGTLGVQAPVVMVLPEGSSSPNESLKAGAKDYVEKGASFSQDLPAVVSRTIGGGQAPGAVRERPRAETVTKPAVAAPAARTDGSGIHVKGTERRVSDRESAAHQREQRSSAEQSPAAEREAKLEMLLRQERETRSGLEQRLADAEAALQDAEQRQVSATTAAAAQLAERKTEYETGIARAASTQKMLDEQLRQVRQSRTAAVNEAERLTQRNAELTSMLTEATATANTLERRLVDLETALAGANDRAAREKTGVAEQANEHHEKLRAQLEQEIENRRKLEEALARAKRAQDEAESQRSSAVTAAAALWAERQSQFEADLAQAAHTRNALGREASELKAALDQARQTLQAHAADVERLTQREAELTSHLTEAATMRTTLERQLTASATALKNAEEEASRHRVAAETRAAEQASEHQAELRAQLQQEVERRRNVEEELARVKTALDNVEKPHSSVVAVANALLAKRQAQFDAELAEAAEARRRSSELETALVHAEQILQAQATDVERLTQREAELTSQLTEAAATRNTLERQLTDAADALKDAIEGASRHRLASATKAAEREREFEALVRQERSMRAEVEQHLAHIEATLHDVEQRHAAAMTAAATERAEREAQFDAELSQTVAMRDEFQRRFSDAEAALTSARHDHATAATKVERLTQREAELTSQLSDAAAVRSTLERQLTGTADALNAAHEGASRNRIAAETKAAEREVEFTRLIDHERATRADVEQRLAQVETVLHEAKQQHAAAATAAATEVERLTQRERALTSELAQGVTVRTTLERQVATTATALKTAEEGASRDRVAAEAKAAEREAEFTRLIDHERATRADVEQRLAQVDAALHEAKQQHAAAATEVERLTHREAELTSHLAEAAKIRSALERQLTEAEQQHASAMAAAAERAEREAQFDAELAQTAEARDQFKRRFNEAETALAAARHDHAAAATEVDRLTQREAELTSHLAEAAKIRSALERQLTATADALKAAHEDASRDRVAAETKAAEREGEFTRLIDHERATRADVGERLAREIARRESLDRTIAEMRSAAADAEQRFRDEIATLTARGRDEVTQLENQFAKEREGHNTRQAALLNEIQNLETARGALDDSLASVREHARRREIDYQHERDGLERARLTAEAEVRRLAAELTDARHAFEKARREFQQTLDRVTGEHAESVAKLVVEGAERDARIENLEKQLDASRRELRRQFHDAPLPLWRCTRDGAFTDANRALAHLVGYREPDELRDADFVKAVFESTDDLSWLVERCLSTKTRQSVETAWKRRNDERLVVRLSAIEFGPDTIEIAVEDITNVHVLEDRLGRAHRMAAVGGLASETAVTCGRLLRDVREDGQQWLMAVSDDAALRKRGERLLGEVARAASYLERLAAHGDEQASALKPVELNRVLRDLKPVLKHVAGDDVALELSKMSSPLNVDMKADRVERLFVNLASYGRERMPVGGRLRIELATVVVDQKFIADHPNVRRGHHALITVTAMRRETPGRPSSEVALEKPGVDLGALQELLQECGGHLWLTVDPPGNMVVKIRLPLRVWDDPSHSTTSDTPTSPKRVMARWFRH